MIALLALGPIRLKNFAALEIGHTFKQVRRKLVDHLAGSPRNLAGRTSVAFPRILNRAIDVYLNQCATCPARVEIHDNALWISSTTGRPMTIKNLGTLVSKITLETLGVDVSPHLFRTAAATTAAAYGGSTPHLASAMLNHTDPRVTEEHYNRASSVRATEIYAEIINGYLRG